MSGFDAFFVMAGGATLLCAPIFLLYPDTGGEGNNKALLSNGPIFTQMYEPIAVLLFKNKHIQQVGDRHQLDGVIGGRGEVEEESSLFEVFRPLILMSLAALAYQMEYSLNFIFVTMVDPVTFAVADIVRRLAVILTGKHLRSTHVLHSHVQRERAWAI